jgi:hypothetical protein
VNGNTMADLMLHHQQQRQVYIAPLAANWRQYLRGEIDTPDYYDWPLEELIEHWNANWLQRRIAGERGAARIAQSIRPFSPESMRLTPLLTDAP